MIEKCHKIFVNRSLNLQNIKAIGFDMDHTLVMYNRENFETLAFHETTKKLIENGYPEELLKLKFNPHFVIRGLLVDIDRGNILKVDGHKYVKIAYHGTKELDKATRHKIYNIESFKAHDFISIDTFFALSEIQLFTEIVDYMEKHPKKIKKTFRQVYQDVKASLDLSHADGSIKKHVIARPDEFIKRDKFLPQCLLRFKDAEKKLFIITNSNLKYTEALMSYLLDDQHEDFKTWQEYFDLVVVSAAKPSFFTGIQPFYEVVNHEGLLKPQVGDFSAKKIYQGGSAAQFQKKVKLKGDELLYVGDHIFGDIMQSKGKFNWRTALILEEIEDEIKNADRHKGLLADIQNLRIEREKVDEEAQILRSKIASMSRQMKRAIKNAEKKKSQYIEKDRDKFFAKLLEIEKELALKDAEIKTFAKTYEQSMHPIWGALMKVGLERSRFANQIESFACVYTSRLTNFRFYSPMKKFFSFHDLLPHD